MTLKISKFVLLLLLFILVFGFFSVKVWDPDFWWHLKTGEYIYQTGSLPQTDPFAFTSAANDPLHPESKRIPFILKQYWLAQVIFYLVFKAFSFDGIIYLTAGLLTLFVFLLYRAIRREGTGLFTSILLIAPFTLTILPEFTGERPQLFSFLFSLLLIYLLEGYRQSNTKNQRPTFSARDLFYLYPVPIVMLLWSNMHGGFILGILIISGYLVSESIKYFLKKPGYPLSAKPFVYLLITGVVGIAFSFINPNGYNVIPTTISFLHSNYSKIIVESKSPFTIITEMGANLEIIAYLSISILCFFLMLINIRRADITDLVITAGLFVVSAKSVRAIPFSVMISTLMIARYGLYSFRSLVRIPRIAPRWNYLKTASGSSKTIRIAALCLAFFLIAFFSLSEKDRLFQHGVAWERYPKGAADFLKHNKLYGNMLNPYVWGGYLIWALYPDYKVFTDGRGLIEEVVYQGGKIRGAHQKMLFGLPEWKAYLAAYNINFIITDSVADYYGNLIRLVPALINDPEWHLVYIDNKSLIFAKDAPENSALIDRFQMPKEWAWTEVISEAESDIRKGNKKLAYYITMGDAFLAMKNYRDARMVYLKAKEAEPGNAIVKKKLEMINMAPTQ
jgi:hypothetical protein